jgi:hypothetical protein
MARARIELKATPEGERWSPGRSWTSLDGEGQNRTGDTTIFSRVLYQLSYLAGGAKASGQ